MTDNDALVRELEAAIKETTSMTNNDALVRKLEAAIKETTSMTDNDALVRKLEAAILGADSADHLRDKGLWDTALLVETAAEVLAAIAALDRHPAGDDALREENARLRGLVDALAVLMPIQVHDGRDYAEVFFAVGATHSTQAMTMNPQHWRDLADAYDRAALTGRQG